MVKHISLKYIIIPNSHPGAEDNRGTEDDQKLFKVVMKMYRFSGERL